MKLIVKSTIRNVSIKPIRTAIMVFCMAAVTLAFSMALLIQIDAKRLVENQIRMHTGKADLIVASKQGFEIGEISLPEQTETLDVAMTRVNLTLHSIDNYKYVQKKQISVLGLDVKKGCQFEMLPTSETVGDDEIIITSAVAGMFGYEKGEKISLPCVNGSKISFMIKDVIPCEKYFALSPLSVLVTPKRANEIMGERENSRNVIYVDVADDNGIFAAYKELIETHPDMQIQQILGDEVLDDMVSGITSAFFLVFAVVFLMVIFIVSGFAKNIAAERMSVLGTLRSIGADKKTAALSLLLESGAYGLLGGCIGAVLFYFVKDIVIGSVVATNVSEQTSYHMPLYVPLAAIFVSVVISCICSLFSIISTAKMPLRDIIFANKDTCFQLSRRKVVLGFVLFLAFGCLSMVEGGFPVQLAALICFEVAICLIVPLFLAVSAGLLAGVSKGRYFPVLRLALIQMGTKKTSVSGTVLCTAVISLTTAVFILSSSIDRLYSARIYQSDIIISQLSQKSAKYENIKNTRGVTEAESIYLTEEVVKINGEEINASVFGFDTFKMFDGIKELPKMVENNQVVLDKGMMKRIGISVGDEIEMTLKGSTPRPVTLSLTVVGSCDSVYYNMSCSSIVLSLEDYKQVYHDYPSMILLKTSGESTAQQLKQQLADQEADLKTAEEYYEMAEAENSSITNVLHTLIFLGVALAVISVAGNQSVSFEQRKREFAVLYSAGMSQKQLSRMIVTELAAMAAFSTIVALLSGVVLVKILSQLLAVLDLSIPVFFDAGGIFTFVIVLLAVLMLTAILPVYSLRKMNTATQLKYE